ncbi:AAA family ATPase [Tumebacillus sp. ITR2]|uniref:AAA family ATPase n=1 Tax=Tumebacillus amylolyticus TaxID=2801339 RepID=A0ABS1JAT1_9BACL|nr:AAA family ATPase [Tumebacillus amylolyticus]MBL0386713.1 AAA family ATPase [Tumebacillus amylolyticus]
MKIEWMKLENFHGFREKEITFHPQFTVLVGDNASGKTAVLEGVSVAIGEYANQLIQNYNDKREIELEEVRLQKYQHDEIPTLEPQFPVYVKYGFKIHDRHIDSLLIKEKAYGHAKTFIDKMDLYLAANELLAKVSTGEQIEIPIFSFFKTSRLWSQEESTSKDHHSPGSRFEGYRNYLNPNANESYFTKWFIQMSIAEIRRREPLKVLESVRRAIVSCMCKLGVQKIDYDPLRNEIQVFLENGEQIPFRLLSDGYRNTMGLVADIAHRMAVLNPFLEDHLQTPGIVLIDELDLHLHPKWQRHIVEDLKTTFPNVQFIVTTHSPFVVQSLEEGELRVLDEDIVVKDVPPSTYVNKSVEDVSEHVMGVDLPQRSEKLQELYESTKHYYLLLDRLNDTQEPELREQLNAEISKTKHRIDELDSLFSDNVAFHAILELERLRLLRGANNETD